MGPINNIPALVQIIRGWDVIWWDLFVQIELGVDITSLEIE